MGLKFANYKAREKIVPLYDSIVLSPEVRPLLPEGTYMAQGLSEEEEHRFLQVNSNLALVCLLDIKNLQATIVLDAKL